MCVYNMTKMFNGQPLERTNTIYWSVAMFLTICQRTVHWICLIIKYRRTQKMTKRTLLAAIKLSSNFLSCNSISNTNNIYVCKTHAQNVQILPVKLTGFCLIYSRCILPPFCWDSFLRVFTSLFEEKFQMNSYLKKNVLITFS